MEGVWNEGGEDGDGLDAVIGWEGEGAVAYEGSPGLCPEFRGGSCRGGEQPACSALRVNYGVSDSQGMHVWLLTRSSCNGSSQR